MPPSRAFHNPFTNASVTADDDESITHIVASGLRDGSSYELGDSHKTSMALPVADIRVDTRFEVSSFEEARPTKWNLSSKERVRERFNA